ncbi:MAG TPA: hypothetical protein VFY17_08245, partial [Pilimelia sp.]|nr:hypothetical protein [Pilimelia sp.]
DGVRLIGQLAARLLRSRYGVALGLAAVVAAILGGASLLARADPDTAAPAPVAPIPTADPTAGDDGVRAAAPPTLTGIAGAPAPEAVARQFATAWLSGADAATGWQARLAPHVTDDLAARLADADPASVPATTLGRDATTTALGAQLAEVALPTAAGTLRLRLVAAAHRWQVDAVDWEPA